MADSAVTDTYQTSQIKVTAQAMAMFEITVN
jgi:hypothetical protein